MKKIKFIFLAIFLIHLVCIKFAYAECSDWYVSFYPTGKYLAPKGVIVFEGYANASIIIKGLNTKYPIFMKSGKHKVRLKVKEVNTGYNTLQAILEPSEPLKIEQEYELVIENYEPATKYHAISRRINNKEETPKWKIQAPIKNDIEWQESPLIKEKKYIEYGCGPAIYVVFSTKIKNHNNHSYYIKASLTNKETKVTQTYLLHAANDNQISIGHGMCSGEFSFGVEKDFSVVFDFVDLEGNTMKKPTKIIEFECPSPKS